MIFALDTNILVYVEGVNGRAREAAARALIAQLPIKPATTSAMIDAIDLATDHRLNIWDSVMMSVAAESGCRLLLSEDMQDGFTWRGVTVTNPFSSSPHPLLEALLAAPPQ